MNYNALNTAVLSLGSNKDNGKDIIDCAMGWLLTLDPDMRESAIYSTAPLSGNGAEYTNAVVEIRTALTFENLVRQTKDFETVCGRDSAAREKKAVPLDIDVVVFNGEVVRPHDFECDYFRIGYDQLNG